MHGNAKYMFMKSKNILRWISLFNGLVFFSPVALLVRTSRGLTVSDFFLLQAVLSIGIFVFEVPGGYITDKIGYKKSLVTSQILLFLARFLLMTADHFAFFFIEAVVEAAAYSFSSGTIEAYLYSENAAAYGEEKAWNSNFGTAGFIISTVLYTPLYFFGGIDALLLATAICAFLAMAGAFFLEERRGGRTDNIGPGIHGRRLLQKEEVKTIGLFSIFKSAGSIGMFMVNFFYITKVQQLGIPEMWMSAVIIAYSLVQMLVPVVLRLFKNKLPLMRAIRLFSVVSAVMMLYLAFVKGLTTLGIMIVMPAVLMVVEIYFSEVENKYIDAINQDHKRATIISISSMGQNLIEVAFLLLSNVLSRADIGVSFGLAGAAYLFTVFLIKYLKRS